MPRSALRDAITWPGCKLAKRSAFRDRFFIDPEFDYANFS
jgi:hypothetical protein